MMELETGDFVDYTALRWESDWNGDEVGYDELGVVGLYTDDEQGISYYIDVETGRILEAWKIDEDED